MLHIPSYILRQKIGKNHQRSYGQCSRRSQRNGRSISRRYIGILRKKKSIRHLGGASKINYSVATDR